jgi:DNA replication protein DnaC
MALTNTQYASVMRTFDDLRSLNNRILDNRYEEIKALSPKLEEIDNKVIEISLEAAKAKINKSSNDSSDIDNILDSKLKKLEQDKRDLLISLGKPANYLDEIYNCPKCHDTGFIGQQKCSCFKKIAIDLVYRDSNLKNIIKDENFDTFTYKWYDDTVIDPRFKTTARKNMEKVYGIVRKFVSNFDKEFTNLLITGNTGVGKTFLTNCIAKELLDSSYSVIYLTAIEFFESFESRDFNKDRDNVVDTQYFLDADLLIIDDLGTENSNSYTNSRLFYIINERSIRKKPMIISANLEINEIGDRYSERVFSRLLSSYKLLGLFGQDIRILKRNNH